MSTSALRSKFQSLQRDLVDENGPRISTMRNYRFAIVQYEPTLEFELRGEARKLHSTLTGHGWNVLAIDLHKLLIQRLKAQGDPLLARLVDMERQLHRVNHDQALRYIGGKLGGLVEGPEGLANDCSSIITEAIDAIAHDPDRVDRTVALIGRAGALYPFFRVSTLMRHLDGRTRNVPVVLFYPGTRSGSTGLSFMGELPPDNDYRPRIY